VDLDNTVLDSTKRLTEATRTALRDANRAGFLVLPVSGRIFDYLTRFHALCELDGPVIGYNGAACLLPAQGRMLFHEPIETPLARRILAFARERDVQVNFYVDDIVLFDRTGPMADYYVETFKVPHRVVPDLARIERPTTKMLFLVEPEKTPALSEALRAAFAGELDVSASDGTHVEILKAGVNKGAALTRLAEWLGADASQAIAIGDGENDAPMLAWAGLGVAVAGAHPRTREAADLVIGPADDESVAVFLRSLTRGEA